MSTHQPKLPIKFSFKESLFGLFRLDDKEMHKFIIGAVIFFCVIASYSLAKELQNAVFTTIVGYKQVPIAKLLTLGIFTFAIFLDAALVDRLKRYQLFILYSSIYSLIGFGFAYLLGLPEIGLSNTQNCNSRILGWAFFIYIEGYMPFVVGVFWALMSSINIPKSAERTYGLVVSCSKIGGALSTLLAYSFLSDNLVKIDLGAAEKIQLLAFISAGLLGVAPLCLALMIRKIDTSELKGYQQQIEGQDIKTGFAAGLKALKRPYVLGVFLLLFCCEALNEVINFQRLGVVISQTGGSTSLANMAAELYWQIFLMQILGFFVALIATNSLLRALGTRICIMLMPIIVAILLAGYIILQDASLIIVVYIVIHALNYTIGTPMRESLYIITGRDIQFKAKFAIDVFGLKCSKGFGHLFNYANAKYITVLLGVSAATAASSIFFAVILSVWLLTAYLTGKKYVETLESNKVIR